MSTRENAYQVCTFKEDNHAKLEVSINEFLKNSVDKGGLVDIKYSHQLTNEYNTEIYTAMVIYFGRAY